MVYSGAGRYGCLIQTIQTKAKADHWGLKGDIGNIM